MQSPACTDPKIRILRGQSSRRNCTDGFSCSPSAVWFSSRIYFEHNDEGNSIYTKKSFEKTKEVKLVRISHWSDSDENAFDCEIACDCVKPANVLGQQKDIFDWMHTATNKPTSAQRLEHDGTHLIIVCGALWPTAQWARGAYHSISGFA